MRVDIVKRGRAVDPRLDDLWELLTAQQVAALAAVDQEALALRALSASAGGYLYVDTPGAYGAKLAERQTILEMASLPADGEYSVDVPLSPGWGYAVLEWYVRSGTAAHSPGYIVLYNKTTPGRLQHVAVIPLAPELDIGTYVFPVTTTAVQVAIDAGSDYDLGAATVYLSRAVPGAIPRTPSPYSVLVANTITITSTTILVPSFGPGWRDAHIHYVLSSMSGTDTRCNLAVYDAACLTTNTPVAQTGHHRTGGAGILYVPHMSTACYLIAELGGTSPSVTIYATMLLRPEY